MVSSLQPYSNYSRYLAQALVKNKVDLTVLAEKDEKNKNIKDCGKVILTWDKSPKFIWQIIKQINKTKPDLVHLQHEINMYGSFISIPLFLLIPLYLKIKRIKTVTTIHAVVSKKIIKEDFSSMFTKKIKFPIWFQKLAYIIIYKSLGIFSDEIIVHTNLLKNILVTEYKVKNSKIKVVPHGVPDLKENKRKDDYFFYFGYIAKRKGLGDVLKGYSKYYEKNKATAKNLILGGGFIKGQEYAKEEIEDIIAKLNLAEKVKLTGFLNEGQMDKYFSEAYCVIIPAKISISASGPLAQAFSYGKCVLASNLGNYPEEIKNNMDGILVNKNGWAKAFEVTPEKVGSIEKNAVEKAGDRNWNRIGMRHKKIYESVLNA